MTLPFFPYAMRRDYEAEAMAADLVYVGGGNTVAMLAVWREFGFDRALHRAWQGGTVLAGISAGANCWFEHYVTRRPSADGYAGRSPEGTAGRLGAARRRPATACPAAACGPGSAGCPRTFCPHHDSEPWRQPLLPVAPSWPAYGAPGGVLLRFDGGACAEAVGERAQVTALRCDGPVAAPFGLPTRVLPPG